MKRVEMIVKALWFSAVFAMFGLMAMAQQCK